MTPQETFSISLEFERVKTASARRQDAHRLAIEERANVVHDIAEVEQVIFHADIAEMRGDDHVVESAERMIERQRLDVENVQSRAANPALLQRGEQGLLFDDGAARGIDDVG